MRRPPSSLSAPTRTSLPTITSQGLIADSYSRSGTTAPTASRRSTAGGSMTNSKRRERSEYSVSASARLTCLVSVSGYVHFGIAQSKAQLGRPNPVSSSRAGPPRQGSLRDSASAPCPRLPSATLDGLWRLTQLVLPQVERERLSFVRDPCASERKSTVKSGLRRIDRNIL